MAYCTQTDIENAIGVTKLAELVIDSATETALSESGPQARIAEAIAQGDAQVDAALAVRCETPLTGTVPDLIRGLAVRAALAILTRRRPGTWTEYDRLLEENVEATLQAIREGCLFVPGVTRTRNLPAITVNRDEYLANRQSPDDAVDPLAGY